MTITSQSEALNPLNDVYRPTTSCHVSFYVSGLSGDGDLTFVPLIAVKNEWEWVIEGKLCFRVPGG